MNTVVACSVVVPVYNVEAYISETIESIITQSCQNIEIILINDGSTDNSGIICESYAKIDSRIIVIHQRNSGVSAARNRGIDLAKGEYICFVDGDDTIDSDMIELLYTFGYNHDIDLILPIGYKYTQKIERNENSFRIFEANQVLSDYLQFKNLLNWHGLLKTEIVKKIKYSDSIFFWEDYAFMVDLISRCNSIAKTTNIFYYYRQREGSANNSKISERTLTCLKIADLFVEKGLVPSRQDIDNVRTFFIEQCFEMLMRMRTMPSKNIIKIFTISLRRNVGSIYRSEGILARKKDKMRLLFVSISPMFVLKILS